MNITLIIYLVLVAAPISTILHETGHALAAKYAKADKIILLIGIGEPFKILTISNIQLVIHKLFFIGGMVESIRKQPYNKKEKIRITISGPVTNAITAMLSYFLYLMWPSKFLYLFFMFNIWVAVVNIIPFKIKGKQTDGYTVLQLIKEHNKSSTSE